MKRAIIHLNGDAADEGDIIMTIFIFAFCPGHFFGRCFADNFRFALQAIDQRITNFSHQKLIYFCDIDATIFYHCCIKRGFAVAVQHRILCCMCCCRKKWQFKIIM